MGERVIPPWPTGAIRRAVERRMRQWRTEQEVREVAAQYLPDKGPPWCPTGYALRYHGIGQCACG